MRIRNIKNAKEKCQLSHYVISDLSSIKGNWQKKFNNNNPIHIEIGMGKGRFIKDLALQNPNINYIGIERFDSILLRATEKVNDLNLSNIKFVLLDATEISQYFAQDEIERIYLNFSDPWPKNAHAKRRLTHANFLKQYQEILVPNGEIHFKTDNIHLFEFSLESMNNYGMLLKNISLDLHKSEIEGNIMTEYEEKFSKYGPIYRLEASFK